jgi:hypothetical protein
MSAHSHLGHFLEFFIAVSAATVALRQMDVDDISAALASRGMASQRSLTSCSAGKADAVVMAWSEAMQPLFFERGSTKAAQS